jgi:hypothetical protein
MKHGQAGGEGSNGRGRKEEREEEEKKEREREIQKEGEEGGSVIGQYCEEGGMERKKGEGGEKGRWVT